MPSGLTSARARTEIREFRQEKVALRRVQWSGRGRIHGGGDGGPGLTGHHRVNLTPRKKSRKAALFLAIGIKNAVGGLRLFQTLPGIGHVSGHRKVVAFILQDQRIASRRQREIGILGLN
jgi:hypothetical protein